MTRIILIAAAILAVVLLSFDLRMWRQIKRRCEAKGGEMVIKEGDKWACRIKDGTLIHLEN